MCETYFQHAIFHIYFNIRAPAEATMSVVKTSLSPMVRAKFLADPCLDLEGRRYWPIKKNCAAWAQILSEGEIFLVSSQLF